MARPLLEAKKRAFIALLLANNMNMNATCKARGIERDTAYKWMKDSNFKNELARRQAILSSAADITAAEVIGVLVSHLRSDIADVLPDVEIVKAARKAGVSHLIKKVEIRKESRTDRATGELVETETIKLEMVDAGRAGIQLSKMMGLDGRDDELDRARTVIRACMAMKGCSPEEAIAIMAPHFPAVTRLREEFAGGPMIIEMEKAQ